MNENETYLLKNIFDIIYHIGMMSNDKWGQTLITVVVVSLLALTICVSIYIVKNRLNNKTDDNEKENKNNIYVIKDNKNCKINMRDRR